MNLLERAKNSFNYRVRGIRSLPVIPPDNRTFWERKRDQHDLQINETGGEYRYFEMLRELATASGNPTNRAKVVPLLSYTLALRPRRIVELGCSFSFYPETYPNGSPWLASSAEHEGVFSTKIFLTVCDILNLMGVQATLTSVDIRSGSLMDEIGSEDFQWIRRTSFQNARQMLTDLDLMKYWIPMMGTDSVSWLKAQTEPIDVCLVDSQHTYAQVRAELENLAPVMSKDGLIIVDDWSDVEYKPHIAWSPDDDDTGVSKGGEFGAILEFLDEHPEWKSEWWPSRIVPMVFLRREQ